MSIPSWAVKGARIVCIDADSSAGRWGVPTVGDWGWDSLLTEGYVYTIVGFGVHPAAPHLVCVHLREVDDDGLPFALRRFRPLVSQKDDLATHFNQYLDHTAPADLVRA